MEALKGRRVELLSPAGSYEAFIAALRAGADAVYAGGAMFGARAYAANFSSEELLSAIDLCHLQGRKLYLTVNTLCKEREFDSLYDFLAPFYEQGLDGVIVQDIGIVRYLKEQFPLLPVHASTQMTITGINGVRYAQELGIDRVVPARELSLKEIKSICDQTDVELECFIHGAMCYSYSGQCLFSGFLGGRSGNRGRCAQPCRLPYSLKSNGKVISVDNESYILSMKDLCTIEKIPELINAGIASFKIEGRMKSSEYVYFITSVYRKYIDRFYDENPDKYRVEEGDLNKIRQNFVRSGLQTGYYYVHNGRELITLKKPSYSSESDMSVTINDSELSTLLIDGKAVFAPNQPAILNLNYNNTSVSVTGALCQPAIKKPVDMETIDRQLRKTGGTEFEFRTLDIEISSDIFIPVKELNELRRSALDKIKAAILSGFRRDHENKRQRLLNSDKTYDTEKISRYTLLCSTLDQLRAAGDFLKFFGRVYVESSLFFEEGSDDLTDLLKDAAEAFIALPAITRDEKISYFERILSLPFEIDGYLVRNFEQLELLKNSGRKYCTDFNLYCFNKMAALHFLEAGAQSITLPLELNVHEMKELGFMDRSELVFYGRAPMMISAGCVQKTVGGCKKGKTGRLSLVDRYNKEFPVITDCENCFNIIYNSAPTYLISEMQAVEKLSPAYLRLQFTTETGKECEILLSQVFDKTDASKTGTDTTRGHFRKSVL